MPKVHSPWLLALSLALLVVAAGFAVERLWFLSHAVHSTSRCINVVAQNDRCGSRRSRHDCTKFTATLSYTVNGQDYTLDVDAGSPRGHNRPLKDARHWVGDTVKVVYSPSDPHEAYRDTKWDVWATPVITLFGQLATLFGAFSEPRRRRV